MLEITDCILTVGSLGRDAVTMADQEEAGEEHRRTGVTLKKHFQISLCNSLKKTTGQTKKPECVVRAQEIAERILRKEHAHDYGGLASYGEGDSDDDAGEDSGHLNDDKIQEATVPRPESSQRVRRDISPLHGFVL